jgi:N-acetylmuramic acid 6-phosphate etherase
MKSARLRPPIFLGIECGGTHTVVLAADEAQAVRFELGAANLKLLNDSELRQMFRRIRALVPNPEAIAIGMAGARTENDRTRIRAAANAVWRNVPCLATNDLETALEAVDEPAAHLSRQIPKVLVLSGTGSCCYGRRPDGRTAKMGGWGHLLGDKGSGYDISLRALKALVFYLDRDGAWSTLGHRILRALQLNEPNELIGWITRSDKAAIAALAPEVFAAARERDAIAKDILQGAVASLAKDAVSCARKLARPSESVQFVFAGSVLLKQVRFAQRVAVEIQKTWPKAIVTPLEREAAWGALHLAKQLRSQSFVPGATTPSIAQNLPEPGATPAIKSTRLSPTEERNPRSMHLDRLPIDAAVELMLKEEAFVRRGLWRERTKIAAGVRWIASALKRGGRLFYVGAGTSGRLGILDASECPPTFRTPPDLVQGIIAGGQQAIWRAIEGAEDDADAGARAVRFRGVRAGDVLVGIAASGRTPFVWGALHEAKKRGAKTILLCFNPHLRIPPRFRPGLVIAPQIGPEILTGSTRLKSGTATKLVLNIFTTLAMVQIGKVISNLMVDLNPSNIKLRDRAARILQELAGCTYAEAGEALQRHGWIVKEAWEALVRKRKS